MWFWERSLISKQPYDPFYYTVPAFALLRNGKLHLDKEIYSHAPEYLSWTPTPIFEKALNLRKRCYGSLHFPPSTSATKLQKGQRNNALATAWEAFWFFLLRELLEIFKKGSECVWFPVDFSCQWDNHKSVFPPLYLNITNIFFK